MKRKTYDYKKTFKKAGRAALEAGLVALIAGLTNPEMMSVAPWIPAAVFGLRLVLDYMKHHKK